MCNGLISATVGLSATKMGLSSRMVIGVVANGVAGAVANGSRRLGLSLGSVRREWCCRTVANGFAEPSQIVIGVGLGVIGDGEARRRLGLGVRLDGDCV